MKIKKTRINYSLISWGETFLYSVLIVAITWLIIFLIIISPISDQNVVKNGNVAYVPYGSTLVVSAGRSTISLTPSEEVIEKQFYFFAFVPFGTIEYSENTVVHWGPLVDLKVKKVEGGIELTKPWFVKFR